MKINKSFFEPSQEFDTWYSDNYPNGDEDHKLQLRCMQYEFDHEIICDLWRFCDKPQEEKDAALARLEQNMKDYEEWHHQYWISKE